MKKTLSLLTLATLITAFSTTASAENLLVSNNSGQTMRVIVLEKENGNEKMKDSICLTPSNMANLQNYTPGKAYKVVAQYQNGFCKSTTREISDGFEMVSTDMQVDINEQYMTFSQH